jgi:hypothetical protein
MSDTDLSAEATTEQSPSEVAVAAELGIQCTGGTAGNFQSRPFLFFERRKIAPALVTEFPK